MAATGINHHPTVRQSRVADIAQAREGPRAGLQTLKTRPIARANILGLYVANIFDTCDIEQNKAH